MTTTTREKAMTAAFNDGNDAHQFGPSMLTYHPNMEQAVREAVDRALDVVLGEGNDD